MPVKGLLVLSALPPRPIASRSPYQRPRGAWGVMSTLDFLRAMAGWASLESEKRRAVLQAIETMPKGYDYGAPCGGCPTCQRSGGVTARCEFDFRGGRGLDGQIWLARLPAWLGNEIANESRRERGMSPLAMPMIHEPFFRVVLPEGGHFE